MFTYLIRKESDVLAGRENEGWNVAINLVWYPGRNPCARSCGDFYRPLFRVADKGSFFVNRIAGPGGGTEPEPEPEPEPNP